MSDQALGDLLAALALMLVLEGVALALFSSRFRNMAAQLAEIDPEKLRWGGLALAILGVIVYISLRG